MTRNADFKRLVRARMQKTGESYAAARAQLLDAPAPTVDEYADLAGMSDEAVHRRTGLTWAEWVHALDQRDLLRKSHREIAAEVREGWPDIGGWWAQTVTVAYERIRGLREVGQSRAGLFTANRSKTFGVPLARLYAAFDDEEERRVWLDEAPTTRTRTERSLRWTWPDDTHVQVWFTDKGPSRSQVASSTIGSTPRRAGRTRRSGGASASPRWRPTSGRSRSRRPAPACRAQWVRHSS